MGTLILVAGENGSGKSRCAENIVAQTTGRRYYIATMQPCSEENLRRVEKHRRQMLGDLLVHYNAEVTPEEKLVMEVCQAGEASTLRGLHGDTVCFAVEGLWRDRA